MSVWYCIPSARPPEEAERALSLWRKQGYEIALWRESFPEFGWSTESPACDLALGVGGKHYPGYAVAVNDLVSRVLERDPACDWCVIGGDDVEPDMNHMAEEIAAQCSEHFSDVAVVRSLEGSNPTARAAVVAGSTMHTFGVMQPTGDRWGDKQGAYADRVCGSAWLGREFCKRINQGQGPLWREYTHMGVDEELQAVAQKYGVLWQRPELIHMHQNWARKRGRADDMPEFLRQANSPEHWGAYKKLLAERQAAGFPGSEPL